MTRRSRYGIGRLIVGGLATAWMIAVVAVVPTAVGQSAVALAPAPAPAPASVAAEAKGASQDYSCSTPIGDVIETVTVSAKAGVAGNKLQLKNVKYAFVNNFGIDITVNDVHFSVPDPNKQDAPYQTGSASVADDPPGWQAGHQRGQIFEHHAGDLDVAEGETIPVAALSAAYGSKGPKGTVVKWKAGPFSFFVVDGGPIDCKPIAPFRTIASVTE